MAFLTTSSLWISALLLVGIGTAVAMSITVLVRRCMTFEELRSNNEVAGFKFAVVGVLFAVLLAFAVIVVWEKYSDAENGVAKEAGAAATLYRLADGIDPGDPVRIRSATSAYLASVISDDWPAMARGQESTASVTALSTLYAAVLSAFPDTSRSAAALQEGLHQLEILTQARRERVVLASGIVPDIIWVVLITGALLTVAFTFFFGNENLTAQTVMTGALSILVFSALLIIVAIDHPFAGTVRVTPEPLATVLADFGGITPQVPKANDP